MKSIAIADYRNIVILTGAGISAASGIKPFRGLGGLWNDRDPLEYSHCSLLETNPKAIWQFYGDLRKQLETAQINTAHSKLAEIEARLPSDRQFTLITQNIDGLHQLAGSKNVIEIHGNVRRTRCNNPNCNLTSYSDSNSYDNSLPTCKSCDSLLRPDIVLFGEQLPVKESWLAKRALRDCDLFVAIGTSGTVSPASSFVRSAEYAGARTILINLEPMNPKNPYFKEEYLGYAEDLVLAIFDSV